MEELQSSQSQASLEVAFDYLARGIPDGKIAEYIEGSANITLIEETFCPKGSDSETCYLVNGPFLCNLSTQLPTKSQYKRNLVQQQRKQ